MTPAGPISVNSRTSEREGLSECSFCAGGPELIRTCCQSLGYDGRHSHLRVKPAQMQKNEEEPSPDAVF
jgi:hypothetical protein